MQSIISTRRVLRTAMLAATVLVAACGDSTAPPAEPAPESFRATLAGGVSKEITGGAYFGRANDGEPGEGWGLILATDDGSYTLALAKPTGALPGVGTYQIVAADDPEASTNLSGFFLLPEAEDEALIVRSGVIRITRATATALVGEVDLRARGVLTGRTGERDVFFWGPLHAVFTENTEAVGIAPRRDGR